ncbi:MAG: DeoR/GlpR transcriptional regulator [Oscillospiraceae bacterium]|nr:DeoR/GlpR transcriptional regulator [Oscillospiraceae bacterium]
MKQSEAVIQNRRSAILAAIKKENNVSVQELADQFGISLLTVRRDLTYLEAQGVVERFHGGARLRGSSSNVPYFSEKLTSHREEKELIARYLARQLPSGSSIFMNGGTTTLEIMRQIRNHTATIITNNVMAFDVTNGGNCTIICSGGEFNSASKTYSGDLARSIIQQTIAEFCILGVNGIDSRVGVTTSVFGEASINGLMAQRCKGKTIIAADSSKIGASFCFCSLELQDVDELVTTSAADSHELELIAAAGVQIVLADRELGQRV